MISYLLILTAITLLITGIILIVRGWSGDHAFFQEVVPVTDLEEFKGLTATRPYPQKIQEAPVIEKKEDYSKKITDLEQQVRALEETAAKKACADQETMTRLTYENNKLKTLIEEKERESGKLTADIEAARRAYEQLLAQEGAKAEESRRTIAELSREKEGLVLKKDKESVARIDQLEEDLASAREAAAAGQKEFRETLTRLTAENRQLLEEGREHEKQVESLKANLELMQKINNQKLNEANEAIRLMEARKSESDRIQEEVLGKQLSQAMAEVGEFRKEREQLLEARGSLQKEFEKIRDFNAFLLEKEKILQYELTKQRAQTLGLEKICEDFRIQIDDMTKSVSRT